MPVLSMKMKGRYRIPLHTLTFKVIGCKKEQIYQDGHDVPVRLTPEPENPFDSRAIAFMCFMDGQWYRLVVVSKSLKMSTSPYLEMR